MGRATRLGKAHPAALLTFQQLQLRAITPAVGGSPCPCTRCPQGPRRPRSWVPFTITSHWGTRGTTRISGSLSCGAREVRSPCAWRGGARPGSRVTGHTMFSGPILGFPGGSVVKNPPANAGDTGLIPGSGRSPGEGNGNPLQYFCLENPMDGC